LYPRLQRNAQRRGLRVVGGISKKNVVAANRRQCGADAVVNMGIFPSVPIGEAAIAGSASPGITSTLTRRPRAPACNCGLGGVRARILGDCLDPDAPADTARAVDLVDRNLHSMQRRMSKLAMGPDSAIARPSNNRLSGRVRTAASGIRRRSCEGASLARDECVLFPKVGLDHRRVGLYLVRRTLGITWPLLRTTIRSHSFMMRVRSWSMMSSPSRCCLNRVRSCISASTRWCSCRQRAHPGEVFRLERESTRNLQAPACAVWQRLATLPAKPVNAHLAKSAGGREQRSAVTFARP